MTAEFDTYTFLLCFILHAIRLLYTVFTQNLGMPLFRWFTLVLTVSTHTL